MNLGGSREVQERGFILQVLTPSAGQRAAIGPREVSQRRPRPQRWARLHTPDAAFHWPEVALRGVALAWC
jgi:hypothetical protein